MLTLVVQIPRAQKPHRRNIVSALLAGHTSTYRANNEQPSTGKGLCVDSQTEHTVVEPREVLSQAYGLVFIIVDKGRGARLW